MLSGIPTLVRSAQKSRKWQIHLLSILSNMRRSETEFPVAFLPRVKLADKTVADKGLAINSAAFWLTCHDKGYDIVN